jgi:hypothetical protein
MRFLITLCLLSLFFDVAHAVDSKVDEVVSKHLDSIGTPEARAAVKTRVIQGALHFKDLEGRFGDQVGYWGYVSEPHKSNLVLKFGGGEWRGERFVFDGEKADFAVFTASRRPSTFGNFVHWQDFILKDGLLGGELSAAWILENRDFDRSRLEYAGAKKIDSQKLEALEYHPRGKDLKIMMYFDPESHHHVMTIYSLVREPGVGFGPMDSANQRQIRYTLEERFSDFQDDNQITLPRHYDLRYTEEPQSGHTHLYEWDMSADKVLNNVELDPGNFKIK